MMDTSYESMGSVPVTPTTVTPTPASPMSGSRSPFSRTPNGGQEYNFAEPTTGQRIGKHSWRKDKEAPNCMECGKEFSMRRRRHHCRSCGEVFCHKCSQWKEHLNTSDQQKNKESRVCYKCSMNHAVDKQEALYRLLGEELGKKYYYRLARIGYGECSDLQGLTQQNLDRVFDDLNMSHGNRDVIREKLRKLPPGLAGPGLRDYLTQQEAAEVASPAPSLGTSPQREKFAPPLCFSSSPVSESKIRELTPQELEMQKTRKITELRMLEARAAKILDEYRQCRGLIAEETDRLGDMRSLHDRLRAREVLDDKLDVEVSKGVESAHFDIEQRRKLFLKDAHHGIVCSMCGEKYSTFKREHHCRTCYRSCCHACSRNKSVEKERECDFCFSLRVMKSKRMDEEVEIVPEYRAVVLEVVRERSRGIERLMFPAGADTFRESIGYEQMDLSRYLGGVVDHRAVSNPPTVVTDLCSESLFRENSPDDEGDDITRTVTSPIETRQRSTNVRPTGFEFS